MNCAWVAGSPYRLGVTPLLYCHLFSAGLFSAGDFVKNRRDALWPAGNNLAALASQPIRLQFELESARLYAFTFAD